MFESLLFILLAVLGCVVLTWYFMNKKVKGINEQLSDKQVVINELVNYAEKIAHEQESVLIKKSTKNTKSTPKPKKETKTKKVEEKPKTGKKTKKQ